MKTKDKTRKKICNTQINTIWQLRRKMQLICCDARLMQFKFAPTKIHKLIIIAQVFNLNRKITLNTMLRISDFVTCGLLILDKMKNYVKKLVKQLDYWAWC